MICLTCRQEVDDDDLADHLAQHLAAAGVIEEEPDGNRVRDPIPAIMEAKPATVQLSGDPVVVKGTVIKGAKANPPRHKFRGPA